MFFNWLLRFFVENYLPNFISCYINIIIPTQGGIGEELSLIYSYVFIVINAVYPIAFLMFLLKYKKQLN